MASKSGYRKEEEAVREARESGGAQLDLSRMKLDRLPESLRQLVHLRELNLSDNKLTGLPEWLGQLSQLETLWLDDNQLTSLPPSLARLPRLRFLNLKGNPLTAVPTVLGGLVELETLVMGGCGLTAVPQWLGQLAKLEMLYLYKNKIETLPESFGGLVHLKDLSLWDNSISDLPVALSDLQSLAELDLDFNPLNPELAAAYKEGLDAVRRYLRAKVGAQVTLNEAKLILIGEGEIGKSCLLGALRGDPWVEGRSTTHGIEIKPVKVTNPDTGLEITLNGWDFGGQRVYRPTHQLFFSSPAIYLVVWKPREGPQQGFVKEWIRLVKHREPESKILVVATHGGPGQRQPDIDKQEIWDTFGRETVHDFFLVDSKPDENGGCKNIDELKNAIARLAESLPEVGRKVPARWQKATEKLNETGAAYLPLNRVLEICRETGMDGDEASLFVTVSHRLGHFIHYEHDPELRDIVVLKPDWLATAMSLVLDDEDTRHNHGLVKFERLGQLWNDPAKGEELRYPPELHPVFLRLMERFDLSYRIAGFSDESESHCTSLIAQLVPDVRPDISPQWPAEKADSDLQQMQICEVWRARMGNPRLRRGCFTS